MEYTSHWMHTNERVKAFESKDGHSCLVDMTIKGLTSTGLLHAGEIVVLHEVFAQLSLRGCLW
jgi:hypothetical protein